MFRLMRPLNENNLIACKFIFIFIFCKKVPESHLPKNGQKKKSAQYVFLK